MKSSFVLAEIFTDNMVFQTGKPIRVFGKCKRKIDLHFKLLDKEISIKTDSDEFFVEFPPMETQNQAFSLTVSSKKDKQTLYNCLLGDVYLFLGGTNISMSLSDSYHHYDYDNLNIRFFNCADNNTWNLSEKSNFETFSALAYLFAKGMHEVIQTPIGIITNTHNDAKIFSWMSKSDIESNREYKLLNDKINHKEQLPLYTTLKEKVIPFSLKAVILYQGENDYPYYSIYENALKTIIKCARFDLRDMKLPFFIIQIAGYNHPNADDYSTSMIRIAQAKAVVDKDDTYLVSAIDFGDPQEINPKDKHLVAKRLSNLVLEKLFKIGKNNTSPTFFSYQVFPDKIIVLTQNNYLNLVSKSNQSLGFFYSENGIDFLPLTGVTVSNNMIVIPKICDYKEIRYAMRKYPACDIVTTNGLPLLPFQIKFN